MLVADYDIVFQEVPDETTLALNISVAQWVHKQGKKTCWYTGFAKLPEDLQMQCFDYIKVGPYIEALGGLKSKTTNQRFYRVEWINADDSENGIRASAYVLRDMTDVFWK